MNTTKAIALTRTIVGQTASFGAAFLISNVAVQFVPQNTNPVIKVAVRGGAFGLSLAAANAAQKSVEQFIDEIVELASALKMSVVTK